MLLIKLLHSFQHTKSIVVVFYQHSFIIIISNELTKRPYALDILAWRVITLLNSKRKV